MRGVSGSEFLRSVFLSAVLAATVPIGPTSARADDGVSAQLNADHNRQAEASASHSPDSICQALAAAAAANDLPIAFFTRLIWRESRFQPQAVSRAGAQGVAQFMPATARSRSLADPFDPLEAIAKSAELLHELHGEFGNLGLAAAAYNAGPGRVRDWLGGRRALPGETRAYVRIVTGRSAEEWIGGQKDLAETPVANAEPCSEAALLAQSTSRGPASGAEKVPPWGVEVVGGPTESKALARYHEFQLKYAEILAGREPHVVIRGVIGDMGAARVRVGADNRADATKLCAELRAAGSYCDVLRN